MLPMFVAAGVPGLIRVIPDQVVVRREMWISVRKEQGALTRIRSVMKFLTHIFESDRPFLLGDTEGARRDAAKSSAEPPPRPPSIICLRASCR